MSKFSLADRGGGRFELSGEMSFATAEQILQSSEKLFRRQESIAVDLAAVQKTDSAGLALLLEWIARAEHGGAGIRFENIPEKVQAIAETAEVAALLNADYSTSSSK